MSGRFEPHLFRDIVIKSGTAKGDKGFKSHSIERDIPIKGGTAKGDKGFKSHSIERDLPARA